MTASLLPAEPTWRRRAKRVPGLAGIVRRVWRVRLEQDLRRLHDALAKTPLAGRYWVWGGLLLGWAREGRILLHDVGDVDFATTDHDAFDAAVPALVAAGFRAVHQFRGRDGEVAEHRFVRGLTQYDFFVMRPRGKRLRYSTFWHDPEQGVDVELVGELAKQPLGPFELLGRTWLKHADHEAELEAIYGDWRVPDPAWTFVRDRSIVDRRMLP